MIAARIQEEAFGTLDLATIAPRHVAETDCILGISDSNFDVQTENSSL
jgi:hypothetical protein